MNPSISSLIFRKANEYKLRQASPNSGPERVILGYKDFSDLQEEIAFCTFSGGRNDKSCILGLKITVSRRPRYIRVMPKKIQYKKSYYSSYSYTPCSLVSLYGSHFYTT